MSHTFHQGEVNELLRQYKQGELALEELADRFRTHRWPRPEPRPDPQTYLEMAARAQEDPGTDVPDSFDDVEAAFFRHDLTVKEYELLRSAMNDSLRAEDRGEL